MLSHADVLSRVRDRHLNERVRGPGRCPCCGCRDGRLVSRGRSTTLLGYTGRDPERDPNHARETFACGACGLRFVRETCSGNVWYTNDGGVLLAGVPSCTEDYTYACRTCSSPVRRRYTAPDGVTPVASLSDTVGGGVRVRGYRTFFGCAGGCWDGEVDFDYPERPPTLAEALRRAVRRSALWRRLFPPRPPGPITFYAKEELGNVIGHAEGLERVDFS